MMLTMGFSRLFGKRVKIINVDQKNICQSHAELPIGWGAVGAYLEGKVILCGGHFFKLEYITSDCFIYHNEVCIESSHKITK